MTEARDNFIAWLRDAHAMEEQAVTMLTAEAGRLDDYPELKAKVETHLEETREHARKLEICLDRLGDDSSSIKDVAGKATAMAQGLSGMFASDEVVKGSLASYTFEHMEIASYRILIAAAEEIGDMQTKSVCEEILQEETAMADWLATHIGGVTRQFLTRSEATR
ncbi:ferritin-like domain-containing protein [Sinorhizobium terangae]|uniref:DUF892 family protein n=1 Tax=Sinorhizobium terangae TaxID=110322 RepID=A0A6N7LHX6_SINTE|nr:DUF892 family protein [Sinorhizobium terangae]MBB4184813.1 ferritin-like metal-binding protein YciE [Sinorhizobium terangae]MQX17481.1 DUF892 family protein [Sinorhizobium terangae]WFU50760.1 DUF892 family protein [Sinorhizobium terangae]